ncbi:MAG TPA: hypothetical protein VH112_05870 [Acidimicrobiales bacterium]|jgi:hypothetical protein|nr:hypothetical protein [Acidimicrobiales bacterium]
MRLADVAAAALVTGTVAAACGGGGGSTGRLDNPTTLASAIRDSAQHKLDSGTSGLPAGTKVTQVTCVNTRRSDYTCDVRFSSGGPTTNSNFFISDRSVTATVAPGGRSYVITSGDL